jgi:hypothetical protein
VIAAFSPQGDACLATPAISAAIVASRAAVALRPTAATPPTSRPSANAAPASPSAAGRLSVANLNPRPPGDVIAQTFAVITAAASSSDCSIEQLEHRQTLLQPHVAPQPGHLQSQHFLYPAPLVPQPWHAIQLASR